MVTKVHNIRIVVPCRKSDLTIDRCILSLLENRNIDFEIIVVDDGLNNRMEYISAHYPVKIFKTAGGEGAGKARNIGTEGFNGKVIVFVDSDVQVSPETIGLLIKPVTDHSAQASVGSYSRTHRKNFFEMYKHSYLAFKYNAGYKFLENTFWSAICAIDFEVFTRLKGFNETYSGAGPEDIDLGISLTESGYKIISVPEASGVHLTRLNFLSLIENDLRKGTEDIYVHWKRRIPLKYNRHVSKADAVCVFLVCTIPLLITLLPYTGFYGLALCSILYIIFRTKFIAEAFHGSALVFLLKSFFLTLVLDIIRGISVAGGTILFLMESASSGRYKPFVRLMS